MFERAAASPAMVRALYQFNSEVDVTRVLPMIGVPTLVLHRTDDLGPIEYGRYLAEHVPGARFVELAGNDHMPWLGNSYAVLDEVEQFLTGARHAAEPDRVLATVLFTDITSSTERTAQLGDDRWRALLESHHERVRRQLAAFSGREIKTLGDGPLDLLFIPGFVSHLDLYWAAPETAAFSSAAWPRSRASFCLTSAAPACLTRPPALSPSRSGWRTSTQCSTRAGRNGRHCSACPRAGR